MNNGSFNKVIKSLALVKINWDKQKNVYLDNFLPFLATLFVRKQYNYINEEQTTINQLTSDFNGEFGLNIPYLPMISIIHRARQKGLIMKEQHQFYPTDKIYKYDFSSKIQVQIVKYERIINEYKRFSNEKYKRELSEEDAEKALIYYLKQHDLDILFAAHEKSPLPEITSSKENLFIFNKFIQNLYVNDYDLFLLFLDIVIGHILTDAIFYEEHLGNLTASKLRNLNLYLDTKIIFRLAGLEGEEIKEVYRILLQEFKEQQINISVFSHTNEEIKGILQSCLKWIESPYYDSTKATPVLRFFKSSGYKESDIQLFINRMDAILAENNIKIIEAPDYDGYSAYVVDEKTLEKYIIETYQENTPEFMYEEKDYTILKDIRSITSVYMLRKKQKPLNMKQAKHLFVTTNSGLAYAARKFEKDVEYKEGFYIPACVTDTFIGTLTWMRDPNKAVKINERKIMADVYSAVQPSEDLLKQYITELEKLKNNKKITEDDYTLLRDSFVAMELLGENTLGDTQRFTPKTPIEILDIINSEAYKKYTQERSEHKNTKEELIREREQKNKILDHAKNNAKKLANWLGIILAIIFIFCLVLSLFKLKGVLKLITTIVLSIFSLLSIFGITIPKIREKFQNPILKKIYGIKDDK